MKKNNKNLVERIVNSKTLSAFFIAKFIVGLIAGIIVFFIFLHFVGRYNAISNAVMTGDMSNAPTPYLYSEAQDIIGSVMDSKEEHDEKVQESREKGAELEERVEQSRQDYEAAYDQFQSFVSGTRAN